MFMAIRFRGKKLLWGVKKILRQKYWDRDLGGSNFVVAIHFRGQYFLGQQFSGVKHFVGSKTFGVHDIRFVSFLKE